MSHASSFDPDVTVLDLNGDVNSGDVDNGREASTGFAEAIIDALALPESNQTMAEVYGSQSYSILVEKSRASKALLYLHARVQFQRRTAKTWRPWVRLATCHPRCKSYIGFRGFEL